MADSSDRSVVITGVGVVSPIGIGYDAFRESLSAGRSGIGTASEPIATPDHVAAEISEFTESTAKKQYLKKQRKSIKVMCREIQLGVASALQAVEHSSLDLDAVDRERFGVEFGANLMCSPPSVLQDAAIQCVSNAKFDYERWGDDGLGRMEPLWLLRYLPNMPGCHIGIAVDARGPNNSLTLDEASGNTAVSEALSIIRRGAADIMIVGTTGTRMHIVKAMHARLWDELATAPDRPESRSRPFDRDRTGEVIGEGACSLVLEDEESARARGAKIYGRVLSASSSCVCDASGNADARQATANVVRTSLKRAGLSPADLGHINAHGLGSRAADRDEAAALNEVFGERAGGVPVIALKSYLGNSGSGCGLLELAGSLVAFEEELLPVTLNYENSDPECPVEVVGGAPRPLEKKTAINLNFTRVGQASAVVIEAA